jgi:streptogramin lyase
LEIKNPNLSFAYRAGVDSQGQICIVDNATGGVRRYQPNGLSYVSWALSGTYPNPGSLDVDPSGNVYVVKASGCNIVEFNSANALYTQWMSCGNGSGLFSGYADITVDRSNPQNVFVLDWFEGIVQEFQHDSGVPTSMNLTARWNIGIYNSRAGITTDSSGLVYIATGNQILVYKVVGGTATLVSGSPWNASSVGGADDITADNAGHLFTVSAANGSITAWDLTGKPLCTFGSSGTNPGQLNIPYGIVAGSDGSLWVSDQNGGRIQKFVPCSNGIPSVTATPTVTATWTGTTTDTPTPDATSTYMFTNTFTATFTPTDTVTFTPTNTAIPTNTIACCPIQVGNFATNTGSGIYGLAVDKINDWLYVADAVNNVLLKYSLSGTPITSPTWVYPSSYSIKNVAVSPLNNWVYTIGRYGFVAFDSISGFVQATGGTNGTGTAQFQEPRGIVIDASGNVFVSDRNLNKIEEFTATGTWIQTIGSYGTGLGQFTTVDGLAFDNSGYLLAIAGHNSIQKFQITGNTYTTLPMAVTATYCSGDGSYSQPYGVAVGPDNYIYDSGSTGSGYLNKFTPSGACFCSLTSGGPSDYVAVDEYNYLYITNPATNTIMKFKACPYWTGTATVTSTPTWTSTATVTGTATWTGTTTDTPTVTPTSTWTGTATDTSTVTSTGTATNTPSWTGTATATDTPTSSATDTPTVWNTITVTQTSSPTTCCPVKIGDFVPTTSSPQPYGIAVDKDNNWVYASDTNNNVILKFDTLGNPIASPSWAYPSGFTIYKLFVSPLNHWVYTVNGGGFVAFDPISGAVKAQGVTSGTGAALSGCQNIAIDGNGYVYVTDLNFEGIYEFNPYGQFQKYIGGGLGNGPGQFEYPDAMAFDNNGNLWVTDNSRLDVQEFIRSGFDTFTVTSTALINTSVFCTMGCPQNRGLAIGSDGSIYLIGNGVGIIKYDASGNLVCRLSYYADYVAVDNNGYLYVTNPATLTIMKFSNCQ